MRGCTYAGRRISLLVVVFLCCSRRRISLLVVVFLCCSRRRTLSLFAKARLVMDEAHGDRSRLRAVL